MSLAATLSTVILDTVLGRLALLFLTGAGGDLTLAREAARQMLADYHPETNDELRLAAEIINFSFHALEALGQAATPEMTLNKILCLRGSAVSLSREAHKSRRKLDQLQRDRHAGIASQPAEQPARPKIDNALGLIEATREMLQGANKPKAQTWTQAYNQRQTAKAHFGKTSKRTRPRHAIEAQQATRQRRAIQLIRIAGSRFDHAHRHSCPDQRHNGMNRHTAD